MYIIFLSVVITAGVYPLFIKRMKESSFNQEVSEYSLKEFKEKAKTPTMGGIVFVLVTIFLTLVNKELANDFNLMLVVLAFAGYAVIGFIDDYLIVVKKNNDGLKASYKFGMQLILAIAFYLIYKGSADTTISIPLTQIVIDAKIFYVLVVLFMFTGASNAVNITDGMDGLSAGTVILALIPFAYAAHLQGQEGVLLFIFALIGSLVGYLIYNFSPAKVFMGDAGSLALGGVLAALAMVLKLEFALIIIGGVFVIETLTVILQIASVKIRKKKLFPYTPIHYTFKLQGHKERNIVLGFYGFGFILMLISLWIVSL